MKTTFVDLKLKSIVLVLFLIVIYPFTAKALVTETQVAKLYVATFNRAPLQAGLNYWVNDSGLALEGIAKSFFDQPETQALYPEGTSDADFVTRIYRNLFNREPASAGFEYWTGPNGLGGNITRDVFILAVVNGAQNSDLGNDADILSNKTEVGLYYAAAGMEDPGFSLQNITDSETTVSEAKLSISSSGFYPGSIEYRQAITKILKRGDISWGTEKDSYYRFGNVQVSSDGSKLLFTGRCEFCSSAEVRPFLLNIDGSGIEDLSAMLPLEITSRWSAWRNLSINDDASKIFFRAVLNTSYYGDEYLYVYDVASFSRLQAVNQKFSPFSSDWLFRINETGTRIYLDKYDNGYSSSLKRNMRGLFYADTGGDKQWYFDLNDMTCASYCNNLNMFRRLGASVRNDRAFFKWNSDYDQTDGSNQHVGLWYTGLAGNPIILSDEHYSISDGDSRGICNTDGTRVIYSYRNKSGDPLKLGVVDVNSGEEQVVGSTGSLNGFHAHMSRSGNYVLVNGDYGDHGIYYQTIIDLSTGTSRDTWSYHLPNRWGSTSNITGDDRYYFYSLDGWPNDTADLAGVYRIDMKSTGDPCAPYVQRIEFSAPSLVDEEGRTIGVQVHISDPQGTDNIDRVILRPLIEGQEKPSWPMGREPLAFPSGDPGSVNLYDDGTNGDLIAGDGIFSFDRISTRKGDRDGDDAWNTWYQHYPLPAEVGIRIIVKDRDNNYAIADSALLITAP